MCQRLTVIFIYLLYSSIVTLPMAIGCLYFIYKNPGDSCLMETPTVSPI